MCQPRTPSQVGLFRQQRKCFVRGDEEATTNFWASLRRKLVGLIVQVTIRLWTNDVTADDSPGFGFVQPLIEPAMLLFPISGIGANRFP
jgi:hypothetical protein